MISPRFFRAGIFTLALTLILPLFADAPNPLKGQLVLLDPGHGVVNFQSDVINPGKVNNSGLMEHKLNMDIVERVGALLEDQGARVFYTRTPFDYWRESYGTIEDNKNRSQYAKEVGAVVMISVHCDWSPNRKFRGVTTYYQKPNSKRLGELVHRSMIRELKAHDRKLVCDNYTVLDTATMPTILVECGFLSHRQESKKLAQKSYQKQIANALVNGLKNYFREKNRN